MEVTEIDVKVRAVTLYPDPLDPSEEIEWVMGDDLRLTVNPAITFAELAAKVREIKGIPLARMEYSLPPSRKIPKNKWDKNLRAVGIYNNGTVKLQPTTPFCWEWEAIEYVQAQAYASASVCERKRAYRIGERTPGRSNTWTNEHLDERNARSTCTHPVLTLALFLSRQPSLAAHLLALTLASLAGTIGRRWWKRCWP